jgi:hypothetical protein
MGAGEPAEASDEWTAPSAPLLGGAGPSTYPTPPDHDHGAVLNHPPRYAASGPHSASPPYLAPPPAYAHPPPGAPPPAAAPPAVPPPHQGMRLGLSRHFCRKARHPSAVGMSRCPAALPALVHALACCAGSLPVQLFVSPSLAPGMPVRAPRVRLQLPRLVASCFAQHLVASCGVGVGEAWLTRQTPSLARLLAGAAPARSSPGWLRGRAACSGLLPLARPVSRGRRCRWVPAKSCSVCSAAKAGMPRQLQVLKTLCLMTHCFMPLPTRCVQSCCCCSSSGRWPGYRASCQSATRATAAPCTPGRSRRHPASPV